jgi:Arc/MetJ-type ribon-helix-helix transcriptional regulator
MNLEIHKPELVQRVNAHIRTGHFHDADELLEKALDALDEQATAADGNRRGRAGGVTGAALSGY